jgi:hypothetical protein
VFYLTGRIREFDTLRIFDSYNLEGDEESDILDSEVASDGSDPVFRSEVDILLRLELAQVVIREGFSGCEFRQSEFKRGQIRILEVDVGEADSIRNHIRNTIDSGFV